MLTAIDPTHTAYMQRAINLAKRGAYTTDPNPNVGCVLVKDGEIVGEGWHQRAGEGHAEVNALAQAGDDAKGATAYVTLEPCSHFGRTPPCSQALIQAGVKAVYGAMVDPNPQVAGRGFNMLKEAGIDVHYPLLESQAKALNLGFIKRMETGLPFVRVKMAMSVDGRTGMPSGESKWITGAAAREDVHRYRAKSSLMITGANTIHYDNAQLTARIEGVEVKQPDRLVLLGHEPIDEHAAIFEQPGQTILVTTNLEEREKWRARGKTVWLVEEKEGRPCLKQLLRLCGQANYNDVMVESGATLAGSFIAKGLVDELIIYMAPTLLGKNGRALFGLDITQMSAQRKLKIQDMTHVGDDIRIIATLCDEES